MVSLVTSLFGLVPVAVAAGVIALSQLRRRQEHGKGLAIAGIAISGAVGLIGAAIALVVLFAQALPDTDQLEYASPGTAEHLVGLVDGDCFDYGSSDTVLAQVVDCAAPHDGELYLSAPMQGWTTYPGDGELASIADRHCYQAFAGYVGRDYETSEFGYVAYAPNADSWSRGDRTLACAISSYGYPLQGAARGSGR